MAHSHNRGPELAAVTLLFLGLAFVTLVLRCYVRLRLLKCFKTEDFLAVFTFMCYTLFSACVLMSIQYGTGKHTKDVPPEGISMSMKWRWGAEVSWVITSVLLKYTVGIFLLRICTRKWHTWVTWTTLGVITVYHTFYVFVVIFQCRPVNWYWLRFSVAAEQLDPGDCWSSSFTSKPTYTSAALNAAADWILGLLPIVLVSGLSMNKRTKISLALVLGLGSLASASTVVRFPYIHQLHHDNDPMYIMTDLSIWSSVENGLGLTASSLATLRPLFRKFFSNHTVTPPPPQQGGRSKSNDNHNNDNGENISSNDGAWASGVRSGIVCRGSVINGCQLVDLESARGSGHEVKEEKVGIAKGSGEGEDDDTASSSRATMTMMNWVPPLSPLEVGVAVTRDRYRESPTQYSSDALGLGVWESDNHRESGNRASGYLPVQAR